MNPNCLSFKTDETLYDPIEVEIDGKIYRARKFTKSVKDEFLNFLEKMKAEKEKDIPRDDVLFEFASYFFGIDMEILEQLDIREIEEIFYFVATKFRAKRPPKEDTPEDAGETEEKNSMRSGDED